MTAKTFTARETALDVVASCKRAGLQRAVNAKRVRAFVRDTVPGYDDGAYTAHLYDARLHDRIVRDMTARYTGKTVQRAASASLGRPSAKPSAKTAKTTTAKPSAAPSASETVA
jgi:hypothetical protein